MKKRSHGGTPATMLLSQRGVAFETLEYVHDPATTDFGAEAAEKLGLPPEEIFKTLVVQVDHDLAVAVVPVSGTLNLKAFANALGGKKASLAPAIVAERKTGYVLGGVSPLGQRSVLPTVIDASARLHELMVVSAGKRGVDIRLAPSDLARLVDAKFVDIARV